MWSLYDSTFCHCVFLVLVWWMDCNVCRGLCQIHDVTPFNCWNFFLFHKLFLFVLVYHKGLPPTPCSPQVLILSVKCHKFTRYDLSRWQVRICHMAFSFSVITVGLRCRCRWTKKLLAVLTKPHKKQEQQFLNSRRNTERCLRLLFHLTLRTVIKEWLGFFWLTVSLTQYLHVLTIWSEYHWQAITNLPKYASLNHASFIPSREAGMTVY